MTERRTADLDVRAAWQSFSRASRDYDRAAVLQHEVREELLSRLDVVRLTPAVVVDVGCGTGLAMPALERRFPRAQIIALDAAHGMLLAARARRRWWRRFPCLRADAAALPLAGAGVDLVFSNLMLQWCPDLQAVFTEFHRVLRPGGLLHFTTFGPDTLCELRRAFATADGHPHVNAFADMHELGDGLVRAGFAEPVMDVDRHVQGCADAVGLMRDLKAIGAHNVTSRRSRGLMGRGRWQAMQKAYERERRDGLLPVTWEVVYGHAWRSADVRPQRRGTDYALPITAIGRRHREPAPGEER